GHPVRRGRYPLQLRVGGQLVERGRGPLGGQLHDRKATSPQHLLVDGLHERLRVARGLDHADIALAHLRGVADEDLGERVRALVPHAASFTARAETAPSSQRCRRSSGVSSGWKATARTLPCRTATGWPSTSARTSTPEPCSSTHGALMNTARSGPPAIEPSSSSVSKLRTWRPNALRRAVRSSTSRWSRSSTIRPAQVASVGVPDTTRSR